jgi:tRNA threonylcarbamoyladenosine biosynthesis protein TsaE
MNLPFHAVVCSENETRAIAESFAKKLKGGEVIILVGELGAGKTFFIKKALGYFGITWVNSPSFAIVNEYNNSFKFYHIDFYRMKSVNELVNIGFDDYLNDQDAIVFIEWGNLFPDVLPNRRIEIKIDTKPNLNREFSIRKYD